MTQALILIVEDNEHNMKLVRDVLGHAGYRTLEAGDAELGIELARTHRPDLILMDVQLPGMNGLEAIAQLRSDPVTTELRVVAVTAFAMKQDLGADPGGRVRRLPREAAGYPGVSGSGVGAAVGRPRRRDVTGDPVILVVDDLTENMRLLQAVLEPRGYTVVTAMSGAEALERVASQPVDMVLLDVSMPGMDGFEVCRRLRAEPATSFLPIVMVTASGSEEKVAGIKAGADDFIPKPFDQGELLARVRSLLRIKGTTTRSSSRPRGWPSGMASSSSGSSSRSSSWSGWAGAEAVSLAAAGGHDRVLGRRGVPRESPPRHHGRVL